MDKKPRKTGSDSALAQLRSERGMTQRELADRIGCYPKDISRWETGTTLPGTASLAKLVVVLDCTYEDLLKGLLG